MKKFILIIPLLGFLSCAASYAQVGLGHKTHKKEQKVDKKEAKTEKKASHDHLGKAMKKEVKEDKKAEKMDKKEDKYK